VIFIILIVNSLLEKNRAFYVSASGNNENNGKSEKKPFKTLRKAINSIEDSRRSKIVVIGTLDAKSEEPVSYNDDLNKIEWDERYVFEIRYSRNKNIAITGKPDAKDNEKAILSGFGATEAVVKITGNWNSMVCFGDIEISGINPNKTRSKRKEMIDNMAYNKDFVYTKKDEEIYDTCFALEIYRNVFLGEGTRITNNYGNGVLVDGCLLGIDGAEIIDNAGFGIVLNNASLYVSSGIIKNNKCGVYFDKKSKGTIEGGEITENKQTGIFLEKGSTIEEKGGKIHKNDINIMRSEEQE